MLNATIPPPLDRLTTLWPMDGARIVRLRWRLHGAWMWPTFIVLSVLDGVLMHWLPVSGDSQSLFAATLVGAFAGLVGIVFFSPLLGLLLRRARPDMPRVVSRDYAGTFVVTAITALILVAGVIHHPAIGADRRALEDAVGRAEAYIGDHAPAEFTRNLSRADTLEVQPPVVYRTCVPNTAGTRNDCVVVDRSRPFASSVKAAGSEPNAVLAQGTQ